jgi:hypothetical protein
VRFLDTNVLLYSISRDPEEAVKRDQAVSLIEGGENALSVQVLQEFYVQATRPSRSDAVPHEIATGLIRTWLRFKVQEISVPIMSAALEIKAAYGDYLRQRRIAEPHHERCARNQGSIWAILLGLRYCRRRPGSGLRGAIL